MNRKMLHNEVLNQNYVENIIRRLFQICLADQRLISDVSKALKKTDDKDVVNCLFYNHFNDRFFTYVRGVRSRENACEILSIWIYTHKKNTVGDNVSVCSPLVSFYYFIL